MTHRFLYSLLLTLVGTGMTATAQPVIFNASPSAQPGAAISLQGNFGPEAKVYLNQGTSSTQVALPILVQSANQATVQIPANLGLDLYQIWVADQGQSSPKVFVNQAQGMHFDTPEVAPGSSMRIFGRNLQLTGASARVRFVAPTGASSDGVVNTSQSDGYKLKLQAPGNLQPGTVYSVFVSNGFGGSVGETKLEQTVRAIAAGADYFQLGVGWASKLDFYQNVYNVKSDPRLTLKAVGNGLANDQLAIKEAIKRANADGGGVVYLPAGTYKLVYSNFEGIRMLNRVVLQGAGKDQTIIKFGYDTNQSQVGVYWNTNVYQAGIADLSLVNVDNSGELISNMRGLGKEIFLQRIRFDLNLSDKIWWAQSDKLVIANSDFTQGVNSQSSYGGPLVLNGCSNFVVANNSFTFSVHGLDMNRAHEGVFENNRVYRDGAARYPSTVINHVLIMNFAENVAVINNQFKVINGPTVNNGDGETIIAEGGGPSANRYDEEAGTVSGATATTLRDDAKNWGAPERNPVVAIVNGHGMGQWRTITSRNGNTLTLDRPWDVIPTAGSNYAIFNWASRNWLLQGNTMEGNHRGITLYHSATTQVAIVNNTLTNSGSIDLTPAQRIRNGIQTFLPMYNNQIVDNTVSNTNGSNGVFIGVHTVQHAQEKTFGTSVIGLEMRKNTLRAGRPNVPAVVDASFPEGFFNYLEYHPPGKDYVDEQIPAVLGSILEDNLAINCDNALYLNVGSFNTYICNLRMENTLNLVTDDRLNKVNRASMRTTSCTPIPPKVAVDASPDRTLVLPTNSLNLTGTATTSPSGNVATTNWIKVSGPNPGLSGMNTLTLSLKNMSVGTYVFRLTVVDKQNYSASDEVTVIVGTTGSPTPIPTPTSTLAPSSPITSQAVVSYSLMNADTEQQIKVLAPGEQINLATLPTRNLNIRANTNPAAVGSVVMVLSGAQSRTQTETGAPYALFGDTNGDYRSWTPTVGSYTLKTTPYTNSGGSGTAGTPFTLSFSVANQEASNAVGTSPSARVSSSQLADCPAPYEEKDGLVVIETENLSLPSGWQKKTAAPRYTGSGYIDWVNAENFARPGIGLIETTVKINKAGKYTFQWHNRVGIGTVLTEHNDTWLRFPDASDFYGERGTRKVYPYGSGKTPNPNGAGADGWFKVYFNAGVQDWAWTTFVSDRDPLSVIVEFNTPGVYKLQISARSAGHLLDRMVLYHSSVSASTAQALSKGETTCAGNTPIANRAPVVASPLADQTARVGTGFSYTFPATAFSDPDGDGLSYSASLSGGGSLPSWLQFNGDSRTFSGTPPSTASLAIRVTANDGRGSQVSDELSLTVNAAPVVAQSVVSYSLMNADTDQEIKVLAPNEQLNLATLPTRNLNIRANTNPATVGSVVMVLSGAQTKTQTETGSPYALYGDTGGDYKIWIPAVGSYTLASTPYTSGGGGGTAGTPYALSFSVVNQEAGTIAGTSIYRINAGGDGFTADDKVFSRDTYASGGSTFVKSTEITNTNHDSLYQTERYGNFSYNFPVSNGTYTVTLHFAEVFATGPNQRKFHVDIEGGRKLNNYDIFARAGGAQRAVTETFTASVTDGMLNVAFAQGSANNAKVSAIEVVGSSPSARVSSSQLVSPEGGPVVKTYPNPTEGRVTIENVDTACSDLTVTVVSGMSEYRPQQAVVSAGRLAVDLGDLPTGLYILRISQCGRTFTEKVIVKH